MKFFHFKKVFMASLVVFSGFLFAQEPTHPQYVKQKGVGESFPSLYNNWQAGQPYSALQADDEEFFISRVKPKARFNNTQTQVNTAMDPARRFLFWCPAGQNGSGDNHWNALPTYLYDSEAFNMWSYVDHFGNWTAELIRMPGAFADICHKNGVTTSVVSAIPWAANITGTDDSGGKDLQALINGGGDKLLKFLRYYGVDGIGFNSEFNFSTSTMTNSFRNLLKDAASKRNTANWPTYSAVWYNLMTTSGRVASGTDGSGGYLGNGTSGWFHSGSEVTNHFFLNYPWYQGYPSNATTYLTNSENTANSFSRSTYDVYAGINMQGANQVWLQQLVNSKISMGVWGAHNMNMLFERRNTNGAAPEIQQTTYMTSSEQFFTGGTQNPVNAPAVSPKFGASPEFCGISKLVTARSSLQGNIGTEPFVTYFNLGNGKFFNFQGQTTFPKEWYNIGMQDYLPTWRWWITNTFMGREAANVPTGIKATFTWNDAWFGGSSLQITGTLSGDAFLHLFKTKYALQNGDKLKIRYKILSGDAQINWACSAEGTESTPVIASIMEKGAGSSNLNKWLEKEIIIGNGINNLNLDSKTLAMMALKITDATDLKVLVGEVSLTRTPAVTPAAPIIKKTVSLAYSHKGADFKIIYKMAGGTGNIADPVYNSDVNTWYYKIYSQQENEQPILCTTTTSWAAYVVGAPINTSGTQRVRYGVSAVSLDGNTESGITWSAYTDLPAVTIDETILIDKPVIKANENFTVKYADPFHTEATKWEILSQTDGQVKAQQSGGTGITTQLADVGIYDVKVTYNSNEKVMKGLVQISGPEVGALPQIYSLKANDSETTIEVEKLTNVNYTYTGRNADGYVSRGLRLPEQPFRIPVNLLGLTDKSTSFSLSFWFRSEPIPPGVSTQMLNIRDVNAGWPANNWGFVWNNINPDGTLLFNVKNSITGSGHGTEDGTIVIADPTFKFEANVWTHLAYVFAWSGGSLEIKLYVNGKLLATVPSSSAIYALNTTKNSLMIGGTAAGRGGLNGVIDEVQFYKKALTAEEVKNSMKHFEQSNLPADLIGYFDFESAPNDNGTLQSTGTDTSIWGETSEQRPKPGGKEGETEFFPKASVFAPGAPFISGTVFKIETLPTWKLTDATVTSTSGNGTAGTASVNYATNGQYSATLTLTNGWGSDTKTFNYVIVKTGTSLKQTKANILSVYPNPFINEVHVQFAEGGAYTVEVVNINGQTLYSRAVNVQSGEFVKIGVKAPKGNYLVYIRENGKAVQAVKIIKK